MARDPPAAASEPMRMSVPGRGRTGRMYIGLGTLLIIIILLIILL
jgi:hypothetical protein